MAVKLSNHIEAPRAVYELVIPAPQIETGWDSVGILQVHRPSGSRVSRGDWLADLDACKLACTLVAPVDGRVLLWHQSADSGQVPTGTPLLAMECSRRTWIGQLPYERAWVDVEGETTWELDNWLDQQEVLHQRSLPSKRVVCPGDWQARELARVGQEAFPPLAFHVRQPVFVPCEPTETRVRAAQQNASGASYFVDLRLRLEPSDQPWLQLETDCQDEYLEEAWPSLCRGLLLGIALGGETRAWHPAMRATLLEFRSHPVDFRPREYQRHLAAALRRLQGAGN